MTETKKAAESESKPAAKKASAQSEHAASAAKHVFVPGVSSALLGPSSDSLNPAYAPATADDE